MFGRIGRPAALLKMSSCTEFSRFLTASIQQWLSVAAFVIKVSVLVSTQQKQPIKVLQEKHFLEMLKIRKNSKDIFQGIYRNLMYNFLQNNSIISSSVISIVSSFSVPRPNEKKLMLEMLKIRKNSKDIFQGIYRNLMYNFLQNNSIISSSVISIVSSFSVPRPYWNQGLFSNFLYFFWLNLIFMLLYTSSCTEKSCS